MPFGGLAPLPLRLGPGGITAEQHARLCADLTAVDRTLPCLSLTVWLNGAGPTVGFARYVGRNGSGPKSAPLYSWSGTVLTIDLGAATNAAGFAVDVLAKTGTDFVVTVSDTAGLALVPAIVGGGAVISIPCVCPGTASVQVQVYAAAATAIGDYGGHLAKRNSTSEGTSTYAFGWYQMLKTAQGTAYSISDTSVRSWGLKAEARAIGTSQRIAEMLSASTTPHGSDLKLGQWAQIQGIQTANLAKWELREQCEFRYSDRLPATADSVDANLAAILGVTFASTTTNLGSLASPPSPSYWPGLLDGDALYDLSGEGVYSSPRGLLTVVVNQGAYTGDELSDLMTRDVATWLDNNLPATDDWQWSVSTGGFVLGTSKLGLNSL